MIMNEEIINLDGTHKMSWLERTKFRSQNRKWLTYSSKIALRILSSIEDLNINQKELAEQLEVTPQQISKIIKGQENLTLKSIAKLSEILRTELISFPSYKYDTKILDFVIDIHIDLSISTRETILFVHFDDMVVQSNMVSEKIIQINAISL